MSMLTPRPARHLHIYSLLNFKKRQSRTPRSAHQMAKRKFFLSQKPGAGVTLKTAYTVQMRVKFCGNNFGNIKNTQLH